MTTTAPAEPPALFPNGDPIERLRVYASRNSRAYHARRGCYAREDGNYFNAVDREINWGEVLVNNLEPCSRCKPYDPHAGVTAVRPWPKLTSLTSEQQERIGVQLSATRSQAGVRVALTEALGEYATTLPAEVFEHILDALAAPLSSALQDAHSRGVARGSRDAKQAVADRLALGQLA